MTITMQVPTIAAQNLNVHPGPIAQSSSGNKEIINPPKRFALYDRYWIPGARFRFNSSPGIDVGTQYAAIFEHSRKDYALTLNGGVHVISKPSRGIGLESRIGGGIVSGTQGFNVGLEIGAGHTTDDPQGRGSTLFYGSVGLFAPENGFPLKVDIIATHYLSSEFNEIGIRLGVPLEALKL